MKNIKWRVLLAVSLLALVSCLPLAAENASAAPTSQTLWPDGTLSCELIDSSPGYDSWLAIRSDVEYIVNTDTHAEYLKWGNATSSTSGTFGIAYGRFQLTDLTGEVASYYHVNVRAAVNLFKGGFETAISSTGGWLSVRLGFGSEAATADSETVGAYQAAMGSTGQEVHNEDTIECDALDRPWSAAEVNDGYVVLALRFDASAYSLIYGTGLAFFLCNFLQVQVDPEDYTPAPVPTYGAESFILRPDGDVVNATTNSSEATVFDALNETNYHSDADNSYIWTVPGVDCSAVLTMTDPETWQLADYYRCTLWVIAKTNDTTPPDDAWWVGLTGGSHFAVYDLGPLLGSYANRSQMYPSDGQSSDLNWTFGQLCNMTVSLMEFENTNITMSQLAVIVEAFSYGPDDGGTGTDMSGMARFLMNGGFAAILGLLGFGLVCAAPIIMVVKNREDDTMMGFFVAILVGIFGLAFLWAGLTGHWG